MESYSLDELCKKVCEIAIDAGKVIMEVYDTADFSITTKTDNSPLTLADRKANELICERLMELTPDIPIISEENKELPYSERKGYHKSWMVYPLDGTKEFIKRNGEFTVNIAMIKEGRSIMGIVYAPALDELYYGIKGKGSWKVSDDKTTMLKSNAFTMEDPGLKVVCSRSHLNPETQAYIDDLLLPEKVSKGSSLKFLILANGGADLYPRLAPTMEWDTAAAQIILEEAGGKVLEATSGTPLAYNKPNLLNPHFYATGTVN